jgi:hypothetical protein
MPIRIPSLIAAGLVAAALVAPHSGAQAQDVDAAVILSGRVVDARNVAIGNAEILIFGIAGTVRADADGRFRISGIAPGVVTVTARRLGFAPATMTRVISAGDRSIELVLRPLPHQLATLHVIAPGHPARVDQRMVAFNLRRVRGGGGTFITRKDIERIQPREMTDLFRLTPGFRAVRDRGDRSRVASRGNTLNCRMRLILDGVAVDMLGNNLDLFVRVQDVEAAEFYRGVSTAPAEFSGTDNRGDAACGVIVVWTRQK